MQTQLKTTEVSNGNYLPVNSGWSIWWKMLRPHTLTASFVPVTIGSALSLPYAHFRIDLFFAMLLACMLIQAATNIFNEYYDYSRGLDQAHSVGIGGTIVRDGIAPNLVLRLAQITLAVAFIIGLYIANATSWWLLVCGLVSATIGYLYSGGPYPISATPFGEIVSGFWMGVVIILISFFIQTQTILLETIFVSIPTALLIGAILMSNNLRDLENDKPYRKTLAIMLGRTVATKTLILMFILAYLGIILLVSFGIVGPWSLLAFCSLPKAVQAAKGFRKNTASPMVLMPAMVATAKTNTIFGLAFAVGLFIQYLSSQ